MRIRAGRSPLWKAGVAALFSCSLLVVGVPPSAGQQPQPNTARETPQSLAPIDLSGNWVSVVTEDWLWRMVTPAKGDYARVPLNPEGRRVADTWDPVRDAANGAQCRAFGVGGLMRQPGRLRITWSDATTLKVEADAGTQTRLLQFAAPPRPAAERTWQGTSRAEWEFVNAARRPELGGSLKVVTTGMRAGYLRKNGVPYSEDTVVTEYFDRHDEPNGDRWFTVMTIVEDPKYLTQPFVTTTDFKKEPDGAKWRPTGCQVSAPLNKGSPAQGG